MELGLLVGGNIAVDEDTVDEVVENAPTKEELGQVEVIVEGFWPLTPLHAASSRCVSDTELLVKPTEDPFPHLGNRDRQVGLYYLFKLSDPRGVLVLCHLLAM